MNSKELRELAELIDNKKVEMKNFLDINDVDSAKKIKLELVELKEKFDLYQETEIKDFNEKVVLKDMEQKNVNKEFNNALLGRDYDNALIKRGTDADGGYLVPDEQLAVIEQFRRQQVSLKELCRVIPTETGKGNMPIEVEADMHLANLTEGEEIPQSQINFGQVAWDVKDYGDIVPISKQMLQDEKCGLMDFIGQRFAKKSVFTENAKILEVLYANTNKETVSGTTQLIPLLNEALNVKLDPANSMNAVIITNQTGFNMLDNMVDGNGREILNPLPQNPTVKAYKGHQIIVMSNAEMPGEAEGKIEFVVADMSNAILFADRMGVEVAVSEEAGFTKNVVYARVIERFDVKEIDKKAVAIVQIDMN